MIAAHVCVQVPCYGTSMSSAEIEQIQSHLPRAHTAPSAVAPQGGLFARYEELLGMYRLREGELAGCIDENARLIGELDTLRNAAQGRMDVQETQERLRLEERLRDARKRFDESECANAFLQQENRLLTSHLEKEQKARARETLRMRERAQQYEQTLHQMGQENARLDAENSALRKSVNQQERRDADAAARIAALEHALSKKRGKPATSALADRHLAEQARQIQVLEEMLESTREQMRSVEVAGNVQVARNRDLVREYEALQQNNEILRQDIVRLQEERDLAQVTAPQGPSLADEFAALGEGAFSASSNQAPLFREPASVDSIDGVSLQQAQNIVEQIGQGLDEESAQRLRAHLAPLCQLMNQTEAERRMVQEELVEARSLHQEEVESLTQHLERARQEAEVSEAQCDGTRVALEEAQAQNSDLRRDVAEASARIRELEAQNAQHQEALREARDAHGGAQAQLESATRALSARVSDHEETQRLLEASRRALVASQHEVAQARDELAAEQRAHAATQGYLATAQSDFAAEQRDHAATQGLLVTARDDFAAEQRDHAATQGLLVTARDDFAAEQRDHAATQGLLVTARDDFAAEQRDHAATQGLLVASQADLVAARQAHHLAQSQGGVHLGTANRLQGMLAGLQAQHAALGQTFHTHLSESRVHSTVQVNLQHYVSALEASLARARQELADAQSDRQRLAQEVQALRRALGGLSQGPKKAVIAAQAPRLEEGHLARLSRALSSFVRQTPAARTKGMPTKSGGPSVKVSKKEVPSPAVAKSA
ncbi:MAG: hypothetical protein C0514_08770 [Candidatus Puniceispirillum sp.]|nr:hypothetical protein [Candidatus Puniceispirillum sp.]